MLARILLFGGTFSVVRWWQGAIGWILMVLVLGAPRMVMWVGAILMKPWFVRCNPQATSLVALWAPTPFSPFEKSNFVKVCGWNSFPRIRVL